MCSSRATGEVDTKAASGRHRRLWRDAIADHRQDFLGLAAVTVVILIGYFAVPFQGKTFSTASIQPGTAGCGTPTGACGRGLGRNDPRGDPLASAGQLEPWAQVAHAELRQRIVPLWNPYQGIGMPLAANMQSAVFDPLLLPFHLHPSPLFEDLTILGSLVLLGAAAYAAGRALRLRPLAAVATGSIYGLSGWFFVFSNNQWFRVYIFLPLIIASVEWTMRSTRRLPIVCLATVITWPLVVGMPEPAFISLVAGGTYGLLRLVLGDRVDTRSRAALRLAAGAAIGLALAAPLLAIFREYLPLSYNVHRSSPNHARPTHSVELLLNWMMPRISPSRAKGANVLVRFFPSNYSNSLNWVGAGAVVMAIGAMLSPRAMRRHSGWPLVAAAALVALQMYGGALVHWTRVVPIWSQVYWTTYGGPVLALVTALLAGIGIEGLLRGEISRRALAVGVGTLSVVLLLLILRSHRDLALGHDIALIGGWPLALAAATLTFSAVLLLRQRPSAYVVVLVIIAEMILLAPKGFYSPRQNPYSVPTWLSYVKAHTVADRSRAFSMNGLLYPDTAGVYQLADPRAIDALYPERYRRFVKTFISHSITDRFIAVGVMERAPDIAANPMFNALGVRYLLFRSPCNQAADTYCVSPTAPPASSLTAQFRLQLVAGPVRVYENTSAAPRAFVVHDLHRVLNEDQAFSYLTRGEPNRFPDGAVQVSRRDPGRSAVVEAASPLPRVRACSGATADVAKITGYTASHVTIDVKAACPGMLVLSDEYFPGWTATVRGSGAAIYPTDGALRSVAVPSGRSRVELRYQPASFRLGLVAFVLGLIGVLVLAFGAALERRRRVGGAPGDR
jgi:hypothetical protein